jgi:hypothetical protein
MLCERQISIWRLYFIKRALSESERDENEQEKTDILRQATRRARAIRRPILHTFVRRPHIPILESFAASRCTSLCRLRIHLHFSRRFYRVFDFEG